jgi:hypothetical protein
MCSCGRFGAGGCFGAQISELVMMMMMMMMTISVSQKSISFFKTSSSDHSKLENKEEKFGASVDPSGKLRVLLHLPVFGSVSKSGPSKLGTIVSNNPAIADACVRTPALCIEGQALGSHEFTPPSQLCILELVVNVSGEVLQNVVRRCCDVLRIEMLHSSSY